MSSCRCVLMALLTFLLCAPAGAQVDFGEDQSFEHAPTTEYRIDEMPVGYETYLASADGYVAEFEALATDENLESGTLRRIHLVNNLKGPVTSLDPLTVLNIPVVATADTTLRNFPDGGLEALRLGDFLAVSGYPDAQSSVLATRIGYSNEGFDQWKLSGFITSLSDTGLTIGTQEVEVPADISLADCEVGGFAAVKARPLATFEPGQILDTVESVRCVDDFPWSDGIPAAIQGFVTEVLDDRTFMIGTVTVVLQDSTRFLNGDPSDIKVGVKVGVRGLVTPGTRTIQAVVVRFSELRVEATGPLTPDAYDPDRMLTVLGIQFAITDQTRVDPQLGQTVLEEALQVEVRGFFDSSGSAFASRISVVGEPNRDDVELRAHVSEIANPSLIMAGVSVDSTDSEFEIAGEPAEAEDFFELVRIGSIVEISDATLEASGVLTGGLLALRVRQSDVPPKDRGVRVTALGPVTTTDYVPGQSITVLGIRFSLSPQTAELPLADMNGPVTDATQVRVSGMLFGDRLVARRIERLGPAQYDDVAFSGPLTRLASPELGMLGATMDISESELVNFDSVKGFFEEAQLGDIVAVTRASYDPAQQLVSQGIVALRPDSDEVTRVRVGAQAPVRPEDLVAGDSLTIMGIRFVITPWTRDPDGVAAQGLDSSRQLRVRGALILEDNLIIATHVKVVGEPDLMSTGLRGPVSDIVPPVFTILGVTVDVSDSAFEDEPSDDHRLTLKRFFELLEEGSIVQIKRATLDPEVPLLTGGKVELEDPHGRIHDENAAKSHAAAPSPVAKADLIGFGVATVAKGDIEVVFRSAFD